MPDINDIRMELERLISLPAEIDERAAEPQAGVDFMTARQLDDFEKRAGGVEMTRYLKLHRQEIAYEALRHTYIEAGDGKMQWEIEHAFYPRPEYAEGNRILRRLRDGLSNELKEIWRVQMARIIEVMHPSLKLRVDEHGRISASMLSLMVERPLAGLPISGRRTLALQVREAVADIAPGFA